MIQNDAHAHGINTARQSVKTKYKVIKCFCIAHDCTKYWYHGTTAFLSKRSSRHNRSVSEEMRLYRTTVPSAERSVKTRLRRKRTPRWRDLGDPHCVGSLHCQRMLRDLRPSDSVSPRLPHVFCKENDIRWHYDWSRKTKKQSTKLSSSRPMSRRSDHFVSIAMESQRVERTFKAP